MFGQMGVLWYEKLLMNIVNSGEIPKHIAIIMDGNRRYAKKMNFEKVAEGHQEGANKLKQLIEWLSLLNGVKVLTVYAFSLLNFKRNQEEVADLMDLAEKTFKEIADNPQTLAEKNCKVNFIGEVQMLEEKVIKQIRRCEENAPKNPKFILNICVCYTAQDEIEQARDKCIENNISPSYDEVFKNLMLPQKPDLLIRTSGVLRMSNFLLMQCDHTPIYITNELWPELSAYTLFKILISYQLRKMYP